MQGLTGLRSVAVIQKKPIFLYHASAWNKNLIIMEIKILGSGCANCENLEKATRMAVDKLGIEARVTKVGEIVDIISYGVVRTPGLVINEKLVHYGGMLSVEEIKRLILENE